MFTGVNNMTNESMPPVAFRPFKRVWSWLRREPNRAAVINAALECYQEGRALDDAIVKELERLNVNIEEIKHLLEEKKQ
jgi:hypothetical protein